MPRKNAKKPKSSTTSPTQQVSRKFHVEFKNASQKMAYAAFQRHHILFLTGCPGTGKTFLATTFAIRQILDRACKKIVLTRPIVEAGEKLGFLPGDFDEKVSPYMTPLFQAIEKIIGNDAADKARIMQATDVMPLGFMRGVTLENSVCILDEAQNATFSQMKLFLSRIGENSKMIICADLKQSDLNLPKVPLQDVMDRLRGIPGIGFVEFNASSIVRHPLIAEILDRLES